MKIVCDLRVLALLCVDQFCVNILLVISLGRKKLSSASMAIEDQEKSKINPKNIVSVEYDNRRTRGEAPGSEGLS